MRPGDHVRVAVGRTIKGKFREGMVGEVIEDNADSRNCKVLFDGEEHIVGYRYLEFPDDGPPPEQVLDVAPMRPADPRSSPKSPRRPRLSGVTASSEPKSAREPRNSNANADADVTQRPSSARGGAGRVDMADAARSNSDEAKRVRCDGWEDKRGLKATPSTIEDDQAVQAVAAAPREARAQLERLRELEETLSKIRLACSRQSPDMEQVCALLKRCSKDSVDGLESLEPPRPTSAGDLESDCVTQKQLENLRNQLSATTDENQRLKSELHDKKFEVKRLERISEKELEDGVYFVKQIAKSSSSQTMGRRFSMDSLEILGMGNYGFVVTARENSNGAKAVIKLQSERWAAVAMKEWGHGVAAGVHPNIVEYVEAFMHRDEDREITRRLKAGFDNGTLTGKIPKKFPECFFCIALEYMNRGTVNHLVEKELLSLEGIGAVSRQVASALAFLHRQKRTHNDIKPENILLREVAESPNGALLAKLADFGLADHSTDRSRDRDLFGYTVWCCALGRRFGSCPQKGSEQEAALAAFGAAGPPAPEELPRRPAARDERKIWRAIEEAVAGMWSGSWDMQQVEDMPRLAGLEITLNVSGEKSEEVTREIKKEARRATIQSMASSSHILALQHTGLTILEDGEEEEEESNSDEG